MTEPGMPPRPRTVSRRTLLTHGGAAGVGGLIAGTGAFLGTRSRADDSGLGPPAMRRSALVVGGEDADAADLAEVFARFPEGNVDVLVRAGELRQPSALRVNGVRNVTIRGEGREASRIVCDEGFLVAEGDSDGWTIRDLEISHADGSNTDDGIVVDYPRRWLVEATTMRCFGGSTVLFKGGLHSEIARNYIYAEDSTGTNGFAGIHVDRTDDEVYATTLQTRANYVYGGLRYGYFFSHANVGCLSLGDIAEFCAVGFRFERCSGELHSPYTEGNTVGIEMLDSATLLVFGRLRDEPVVTWSAVDAADRRIVRVGATAIAPGNALVFGGASADIDPTTAPSIRWGPGDPEGVQTGVVGSEWNRTDGVPGATKYVKESGAGTTGWRAL